MTPRPWFEVYVRSLRPETPSYRAASRLETLLAALAVLALCYALLWR